jgi:cephalosporin-C deacetylase-like acetyl esterase
MRRMLLPRLLFLCLALTASIHAASPLPLPSFTPWDTKALGKTPAVEWLDRTQPVHSLLYTGEPYQGKATKVFAYYASPVTLGSEPASGKKFPAIVLVHGGGGTAFEQWAQVYAKRGYAAIAMDLAGHWQPDRKNRERHPEGGPGQDHTTKFRQADAPDKDQWTYHAVANVLLAHSLLRSFPEVDAERTGVTGISWGGYLTCIVAGVDWRFKAACPMYGCGFLGDNSAWTTSELAPLAPAWREKWLKMWDPSSYVGSAPMRMLFVNGSNDFAYPLDSYMKTYRLVQSAKNIRIEPAMAHGHLFDVKEVLAFFDSVFQGGTPLPRVTRVAVEKGQVVAEVESPSALQQATLQFTSGPHRENKTRPWQARPLAIDGKTIRGDAPPADATAWYVTVTDERGLLVSSEVTLP